jgi:sulfate adenylyltransferase subunit 2
MMRVRFRTLGCYPLTGAIESAASHARDVAAEVRTSTCSERQGRLIDHDEASSMERKKREGYF